LDIHVKGGINRESTMAFLCNVASWKFDRFAWEETLVLVRRVLLGRREIAVRDIREFGKVLFVDHLEQSLGNV
jgi:hypothetical protein